VPGPNVIPLASAPHSDTVRPFPARAPWVEPVSATDTGLPSMVRRFERHAGKNAAEAAPMRVPGMPSSAIPSGSEIGACDE